LPEEYRNLAKVKPDRMPGRVAFVGDASSLKPFSDI